MHGRQGTGTNTSTQGVNTQVLDMLTAQSTKDQEACREEAAKTHDTVRRIERNTEATNHNPIEAAHLQLIKKKGANIGDRIRKMKMRLSTNQGKARKYLKDV